MIGRPEESLARTVLGRYLGVRPGETVTVEAWSHALRWARAFVVEARRLHAEPSLVVEDEEAFFRSLGLRSGALPEAPAALAGQSDAYVYLPGPEAFPRLFGLAPREFEAVVVRHGPAWRRAARRAGLRAARLLIATATPTAAARYGVEAEAWQRDVLRASMVSPERLARTADRIVRQVHRSHRIRVRHPNGTDFAAELAPNTLLVQDGRLDRTDRRAGRLWMSIPTGLVAVGLAEGSADGRWESNRPQYDRFAEPPLREGARLRFARGRLREYSLERGGAAFAEAYARGGRGRELASAVTFGVNPAVGRAPELERLAAGTVGLVLGNNRAVGGRNRSRFSYLAPLAGADVDFDGRPWWVRGRPIGRAAGLSRPSSPGATSPGPEIPRRTRRAASARRTRPAGARRPRGAAR